MMKISELLNVWDQGNINRGTWPNYIGSQLDYTLYFTTFPIFPAQSILQGQQRKSFGVKDQQMMKITKLLNVWDQGKINRGNLPNYIGSRLYYTLYFTTFPIYPIFYNISTFQQQYPALNSTSHFNGLKKHKIIG